jgi:hypothetical protein
MKAIVGLFCALVFTTCISKEEKLKKAEEAGKLMVEEKSRFARGIGNALESEGGSAAESLGEGFGEVIKGFNVGFDRSLTKINVQCDPKLNDIIKLGRTAKFFNDSTHKTHAVLYCIYNQAFQGLLSLKAFDRDSVIIGQVKIKDLANKQDAKFLDFEFDDRTPLDLAEGFKLEIVEAN